MKKQHLILFLSVAFIFALLLRLYNIATPTLYADETNGHYWMNFVINSSTPILLKIYHSLFYGTFTATWAFGPSPLGVRFFSAVYTSGLAILFYFLARSLSVSQKSKSEQAVAPIMTLLATVIPWSYMLGRIGHTHLPILLILTSFHLILYFRANSIKGFLISLIPLGFAMTYYQSMIIVGPAATSLVIWQVFKLVPKNKVVKYLGAIVVTLIAVLFVVNSRYNFLSLASRGMDLAIWRDVNTPWEIDKYRALSWNSEPSLFSFGLPPEQLANKLVYNRIVANLSVFTRNYLSFFSPDWLFLRGDAILRHSTGQVGAFYLFLLPFMLYGAFRFFKDYDKKARITFLVWILVSPIPAAITKDGAGYLLRAVTMLPFLTYFAALGLVESFNLIKKNWRVPYGVFIALIGIYSAYYFFYGYFHVYPSLSARAYEYGFKELSDFQVANGGKTLLVVWDGYYPVGHFLFWQKVPFGEYQKMKYTPIGIGQTTFWKTLPNLFFSVPKETKDVSKFIGEYKPDFLVLPDRHFVKYSDDLLKLTKEKILEIPYPDKTTAFTIYSLK